VSSLDQMAKRDPINFLRRAYWAVEDRILWDGRNALRRVLDVVRWPLERLAWPLERKLVWPLRERLAGGRVPTRAVTVGVLGAVAVVAVATGAILTAGDGGESSSREAQATPVLSAPATTADPKLAEPVLQGAPPRLDLDGAVATAPPAEDPASEDVVRSTEGAGASEAASASSSAVVPAGPDAMQVARRFAEAFVVYEVGEQRARARAAFDETAAPALAGALAKRPPRLPERVKVPQAKVVNVVPGPRRGKAYSVSVSLLRLGVTSELRLELRKNQDGWLVTDVRG
jgi:hypothetical protein